MRFQIKTTISEEDYLDFRVFNALECAPAKKTIMKRRIFFITLALACIAILVLRLGWTPPVTTYTVVVGLYTAIYMLLYKKILCWQLKSRIKKHLKARDLPSDSVMEFYDDKLVDISKLTRIEQSYDALERIYIVKEKFVLPITYDAHCFILPIPQIREQVNETEFLSFLAKKCSTIEYY